MTQAATARTILRRIVPWALESNSNKSKYRSNYKGARGRIAIVGGARDYAGAPYFASISAMKLGADLAYVVCSSTASQAIKNYSPDLIVTPLLDCPSDTEFASEMDCLLSRMHAVVVGPGLGREKQSQLRAKQLISQAKARHLPLVLDADSLLLVIEDPSIIKSYSKALLTPNRVELQRLLNSLYSPKNYDLRNMSTSEIRKLVEKCSIDLGVTILAKGMVDIISQSCPDSMTHYQLSTNELSGSNRRCGGQGDITAGLAGTYLHWIEQFNQDKNSLTIEHSTAWAAYLAAITTRCCNELAYKEFRNGMLASNMIDKVHLALDLLLNTKEGDASGQSRDAEEPAFQYTTTLSKDEITRYNRQMIMEEFGPERQVKLTQASAIIIGAGGLGCPAAVYLGAAGIGRLGIVDDDIVEISNLHRQMLHNLNRVGMLKTESIKEAVLAINPNVQIDTHSVRLTRKNAVQLIENYDIVLDATDNLITRYMINDACVIAKKPLVSGAALKMDGQLTVYNYDNTTPCFRCLFPEPPPTGAVGSCSDNGVLGVIPGIIGVQQALEAMKIVVGLRPAYAGKMLLFDGQMGSFRHITLSARKTNCEACGFESKLDRNLINYEEFCGQTGCQTSTQDNSILNSSERVSIEQYRDILVHSRENHLLIDVRPLAQSGVSKLAHAIPIPVVELMSKPARCTHRIKEELKSKKTNQIYVICRRGIASQRGVKILQNLLCGENVVAKDVVGGMTAWAKHIDPNYSCI